MIPKMIPKTTTKIKEEKKMNNVCLVGRFTKDPKISETEVKRDRKKEKLVIARFTLAVDRIGDGADFISCVAFGKTAEFIEEYFFKGMKAALTGSIQTGSFENKDGDTVYTTDVNVARIEFCEKKEK